MKITAYRTTMPFLDNRLSPLTNKGRPLQIDRDLKRRKDLDFGTDHRMISNLDTIAPEYLLSPIFHGEIEWNRSGLVGSKERRFVVYVVGGQPIVYNNKTIDAITKDLKDKNIRWRLISPIVASTNGFKKHSQSKDDFIPFISSLLAGCFKVESESYKHNVREIGSCFYIMDNLLLTCAHVVSRKKEEDLSDISIFIIDGEERYWARPVDIDYDLDMALLYCDAPKHSPLKTKSIDGVDVGSEIVCVGSPYGYDNNVTKGILSSKDRDVRPDGIPYFFMDLSVYPGSSGGPVVDANDGAVIGMAAVIVESVGNYGLNAALPIDACLERFSKFLKLEER